MVVVVVRTDFLQCEGTKEAGGAPRRENSIHCVGGGGSGSGRSDGACRGGPKELHAVMMP